MRSDLKKDYTQRNTERAGQTEKALYLLNTISAITDRGNNAEVRRKILRKQRKIGTSERSEVLFLRCF